MKHFFPHGPCETYALSPGQIRQFIDEVMHRDGAFCLLTRGGKTIPCNLYRWDENNVFCTNFIPLNDKMRRLPMLTAVTFDPSRKRPEDRRFVLLEWKKENWYREVVLDGSSVNLSHFGYRQKSFSTATMLDSVNGAN